MAIINENYLKLKAGYLFPEIGKRVKKYSEELTAIEMEEILNKSATTHKKFIEAKILGVEAAEENLIQL